MSTKDYTGTEVLEDLQVATNYTNSLVKLISRSLKINKSSKVLDFGAGIGSFAKKINSQTNADIECFELDQEHIKIIEKKGLVNYTSYEDIENNKYDKIYSLNVFEHIEDDCKHLIYLIEKLKSKGEILIFVPAFQILYSNFDEYVGHHRRYTKKSLTEICLKANLEIISTNYFDSIGFFAAAVFKYTNRSNQDITKNNILLFDRIFFPLNYLFDRLILRSFGKNVYIHCRKK